MPPQPDRPYGFAYDCLSFGFARCRSSDGFGRYRCHHSVDDACAVRPVAPAHLRFARSDRPDVDRQFEPVPRACRHQWGLPTHPSCPRYALHSCADALVWQERWPHPAEAARFVRHRTWIQLVRFVRPSALPFLHNSQTARIMVWNSYLTVWISTRLR